MAEIELTAQQTAAIAAVREWFEGERKSGEPNWDARPTFTLAGYAGTGKSTLIPHIVKALELRRHEVVYGSFTGKAARVMESKTGRPARTIHSLIYKLVRLRPPKWALNRDSKVAHAKLVVIDEVSMVSDELLSDLLTFDTPILMIGDNFQLPPIERDGIFDDYPPDFTLTEVHRQALESPVLYYAHKVREGAGLDFGTHSSGSSSLTVTDVKRVPRDDYMNSDVVICHYNSTRTHLNEWYRRQEGRESNLPVSGDRLICTRNQWDLGIHNGLVGTCAADAEMKVQNRSFSMDVALETGDVLERVLCDYEPFSEVRRRKKGEYPPAALTQWDFGYALTCHKAQGSQYRQGILVVERAIGNVLDRRWLYTGLTRFSDHCIVAYK